MKPFLENMGARNPGFCICISLILLWTISTAVAEKRVGIDGKREPCSNEGEIVTVDSIKNMNCFRCICKNGFVECPLEVQCPPVDNCYVRIEKPKNECCAKCKGCTYEGKHYASDTSWRDKRDACASFHCEAGVVTSSRVTCYTPCERPKPPADGECCPTCDGCVINGQQVTEGRDVTTPEDPCLRCSCTKGRLTCSKKACPVLQCPITKQRKIPGECCPKCDPRDILEKQDTSCFFDKYYYPNGKSFEADPCSSCRCVNGTSICERNTCPVLECRQDVQLPAGLTSALRTSGVNNPKTVQVHGGFAGSLAMMQNDDPNSMCCPSCPPIEKVRKTCTFKGTTYKDGDSWKLDACSSCQCRSGEMRCASERCPKLVMGVAQLGGALGSNLGQKSALPCPPGQRLVLKPGQCCRQCVENDGVCTVFGDSHYRTFDGAYFSHSGACKYLLAADCSNSTSGGLGAFSIRITSGETRRFLWNIKRRRRGNKENQKHYDRRARGERNTRDVTLAENLERVVTIAKKLNYSNSYNSSENIGDTHKRDEIIKEKSGKIRENDSTTKSGARLKLLHKVSRRDGAPGEAFVTTASAWTRTITLRIGDDLKVNLGRRQRVKVNGQRIALPYFLQDRLNIDQSEGDIKIDTNVGITLLWDGVSVLEVISSTKYKGKLCGLCGNFNSIGRDDLISRGETIESATNQDIRKFAESWRVGGKKACSVAPFYTPSSKGAKKTQPSTQKKNKQTNGKSKIKPQDITNDYFLPQEFKCDRRMRKQANLQCRLLKDSELFGGCDSRLNPENFISACLQDVCKCLARSKKLKRVVRSQSNDFESEDDFTDRTGNSDFNDSVQKEENRSEFVTALLRNSSNEKSNKNEISFENNSSNKATSLTENSTDKEIIGSERLNVQINSGSSETQKTSESSENLFSSSDRTFIRDNILKNSFKLLNGDSSSTVKTVNRHFFTNDERSDVSPPLNYKHISASIFSTSDGDDILKDSMRSRKMDGAQRQLNIKGNSEVKSATVVGCHCAAFTAYARSCSRLGAVPTVFWKNATGCERRDGEFFHLQQEQQFSEKQWQKQRRRKPLPYATLVPTGGREPKHERRVQSSYESLPVNLHMYELSLREKLPAHNRNGAGRRKPPPELN